MKYTLKIELEVDDDLYGTSRDSIDWLIHDILLGQDMLLLQSKEIGDEVGIVEVLSVETPDGRVVTK